MFPVRCLISLWLLPFLVSTAFADNAKANQFQAWVKDNILDLPPGKWPVALLALNGCILGFFALWGLLKVLTSAYAPDPANKAEVSYDGKKDLLGSGEEKNRPQELAHPQAWGTGELHPW